MKQPSGTCKFLLAMLLSLLSACASVDFDLELHSVLWEPDEFPSEAKWNELGSLAEVKAAKWMLWEGEPLAESVARLKQMGIDSLVFDPCASVPEKGDYLSVMQANLAQLQLAL